MAGEPAAGGRFEVDRVRADFPQLADGYAYLDGAAGTQTPIPVIEAIADAYRHGLSNTDGHFPSSHRADAIVAECRRAVADLVGGVPEGVVLGPNMTTLTYRMAQTLARHWRPGDEIIVSQLDHDADVRPWVQAAERTGVVVRWATVDPSSGELGWEQYRELLGERTRLVAVTAASNLLGIRPEVRRIAELAHAVGALVYVDGVHNTPHFAVDMAALGADFYATSAYKWCGPHVGAVVASPSLLETLAPDKLLPSGDSVPERFEWGTPQLADLAGVTAAVDHLAAALPQAQGTRRQRILRSMAAVEEYEQSLFRQLLEGLGQMGHVTLYGRSAHRAPTAYFAAEGRSPDEVAEHLAARHINVWSGDNYAFELVGALGLRAAGGAVRAGLVHYNDAGDVERLLAAVRELKP